MMQHPHPLDSHHNHHHHHTNGTATMQIPSSSSSSSLPESTTRTTMVTLVSPTLLTNGITAKNPPVLSMEVHYLPDPYSSIISSNNNNNKTNNHSTNNTSSQLRPYFLLRRERLLPQQQPTPPHCGGDHASGTADDNNNNYRYQLCEMTLMENNNNNNYQSFLIANHNPGDLPSYVVQDGSLYALTPLDPLFWLLRDSYLPTLATHTTTTSPEAAPVPSPKLQWQPLWQFMQEYDPVVQQCVGTTAPPRQYRHLLNEMSLGDDDDDDSMVLVQFSVEKALRWLHLKQQTVEQYLLQSSSSSPTNHPSQSTKGGFSSGFTIAKVNHGTTDTNTTTITTELDAESKGQPERHNNNNKAQLEWRRMIKEESIQVVCNYLSSAWQAQWWHYLNHQHDPEYARWMILQEPVAETTNPTRCPMVDDDDNDMATRTCTTQQPTVDWNMSLLTTTTGTESLRTTKAVPKIPPPMTAGAKRLLKPPSSSSQRGLQSVASFFQSKKLTKK